MLTRILGSTLVVLALCAMAAAPAEAELVFFHSGRSLSVKAVRTEEGQIALYLRSGGHIVCDPSLIARVEPDEVEYPEDVAVDVTPTIVDESTAAGTIRGLIDASATRNGVDPRIVRALIQVESGYQSSARSPKGARGLMQLLPSTGQQYGALDLFDPAVNIEAGVRHLKRLLGRYNLPVALAAYNAGEGAVDRFGGIPPFRETRNYVSRILRLLQPT